MEYGVYGDLILIYPKPYFIYLRGIIGFRGWGSSVELADRERFVEQSSGISWIALSICNCSA